MRRAKQERPLFLRRAFTVPIRSHARKAKEEKKKTNKPRAPSVSVFGLLCKDAPGSKQNSDTAEFLPDSSTQGVKSNIEAIGNSAAYVETVKRMVSRGEIKAGSPWILPDDPFQAALATNTKRNAAGEQCIDANEALALVLRPPVFAWAPEKIFPGARASLTQCIPPCCGFPA